MTDNLPAVEQEVTEEMMGNFPLWKFKTMKNKEKKHMVVTMKNGKRMKAWQYLDMIEAKLRMRTKNPSDATKQLIDPQTSKAFSHESELKKRWNDRGLLGVSEYIDYVNQSIGLIAELTLQMAIEDMAKQKQRRILDDIFGGTGYVQPINQKEKGNENERATARFLQEWTGVDFIRTPSSGGRRLRKNDLFVGDVVCGNQDFNFPCVVETKHYESVNMKADEHGNLRSNSQIYTWWEQVEADAKRAGKLPLFFIRENGMPRAEWFVFMPTVVAEWTIGNFNLPILVTGVAKSGTPISGLASTEVLKIPFEKFAEQINLAYLCAVNSTENGTSTENK